MSLEKVNNVFFITGCGIVGLKIVELEALLGALAGMSRLASLT